MKRLTLAILLILLSIPTLTIAQETTPEAQNPLQVRKDAIYHLLDQAYNFGSVADVATLFAADYVRHPDEGDSTSFIISALALRAAMPDLHATIDLLIAQDDLAAVRMRLEGTFENELIFPDAPPIAPNGQPMSIAVHLLFRFNEAGLVAEEWDTFDNLHFFAQLGLVPMPQTVPTIPMTITDVLPTAMEAQNIDTVTQYLAGLNQGSTAIIEQRFREDFLAHNPFGILDRGGVSVDVNLLRSALPDLSWTLDYIMAEGNWVMALYTVRGTFSSNFVFGDGSSVAPTGGALELLTLTLYRFDEQGAVVETWEVYDSLSFLTQLGLLSFVAPQS